jgi:hypothetical protein
MKPWYESKTVWFNVIAALVAVAGFFGYTDFVPDPRIAEMIAGVAALVNLYLRFRTDQAIG